MSYLETAFISRNEYKTSESKRLVENEMVADELYTAMFALANNRRKHEAAKLPIKLLDIAIFKAGPYIASIGLLDQDLQVWEEKEATFSNGYWSDVSKVDLWDYRTGDRLAIEQAHIKPYRDEIDDDLYSLNSSQDLVFDDSFSISVSRSLENSSFKYIRTY